MLPIFRLSPLLLVTAGLAPAAIPGAWETFATEARADAWTVYDYADDELYIPSWNEDEEFAYFYHLGDEPLWFFANEPDSEALVGDFAEAGIQAIWCDALIEDLDEFDLIDCAILADGPEGETYYYSTPYYVEDLDDSGWWSLRFGFEEIWYQLEDDEFVEVAVTEEILTSVKEIGFRFYPRLGTTFDAIAAIDDVLLEPTVTAPETGVSVADEQFRLAFDFAPGNAFTIEKLQLPGLDWEPVDGQVDLRGSGTHQFSTPLNEDRGIFRVVAIPWYTLLGEP